MSYPNLPYVSCIFPCSTCPKQTKLLKNVFKHKNGGHDREQFILAIKRQKRRCGRTFHTWGVKTIENLEFQFLNAQIYNVRINAHLVVKNLSFGQFKYSKCENSTLKTVLLGFE